MVRRKLESLDVPDALPIRALSELEQQDADALGEKKRSGQCRPVACRKAMQWEPEHGSYGFKQPFIEKSTDATQFQDGNKRVPVGHGSPPASPGVQVVTRQTEGVALKAGNKQSVRTSNL